MVGGAGVSGKGVGGISVAASVAFSPCDGDADGGKEVTDILQLQSTHVNAQIIKVDLKFIQNVSFSPIQTTQRR
jgi:hypothetical protein